MLRRLHHDQPESFAFKPANQAWAEAQVTKYPEGRQASAVIPLLWRAQEQEGWLSRPAIEHVADMLGMEYIRVLEVATFYFMFQLQPVGEVAHIQVCGTLSCMVCGAEDLMEVLKRKVAQHPHLISEDGKFSWEEVECLGACSNAPMAQIGKDYYEDLTPERLEWIVDEMAAGRVPVPGPQNGRYAAEPLSGLTSLTEYDSGKTQYNASAQMAADLGETIKRIDGTEVPLNTPWQDRSDKNAKAGGKGKGGAKGNAKAKAGSGKAAKAGAAGKAAATSGEASAVAGKVAGGTRAKAKAAGKVAAKPAAKPASKAKSAKPASLLSETPVKEKKPRTMKAPLKSGADDLKLISGVGPKLEAVLNDMGFWHFDQVAKWTAAEIAWVDERLKFKGRIERDNWIDQADILAKGGETEFSRKANKGK